MLQCNIGLLHHIFAKKQYNIWKPVFRNQEGMCYRFFALNIFVVKSGCWTKKKILFLILWEQGDVPFARLSPLFGSWISNNILQFNSYLACLVLIFSATLMQVYSFSILMLALTIKLTPTLMFTAPLWLTHSYARPTFMLAPSIAPLGSVLLPNPLHWRAGTILLYNKHPRGECVCIAFQLHLCSNLYLTLESESFSIKIR